jgi:c-di-GMP-binding flagellar brake protein YcgR
MVVDQAKIGQAVTLVHTDEMGRRTVLEGFVQALEGGRLRVSLAKNDDSTGLLSPGDDVRVRYSDDRGLCHFLARILDVQEADRILALLEVPPKVERQQRRRFMRLSIRVPITCVREGQGEEVCQATTLEVGGNGAGLVADCPFQVGERVRFRIEFGPEWGSSTGIAQVKRSVLALTPKGAEHRLALQFVQIDAKDQALILSYLLAARHAGVEEAP